MTKRTAAKHKIDRRLGENLWGRAKSPLNGKRPGPPGMSAEQARTGRRSKVSDFGLHLQAKRKLRGHYGDLTEKQFRRTFNDAQRQRGETGANLIELLERRLDSVVYRAKFVPTIFAARQFVNHGHVTVNGKRVNIPSYRVKDGDLVEVREVGKQMALLQDAVLSEERPLPQYLEVDHETMTARFLYGPEMREVPFTVRMEPNLVVEYYAKN